MEIVIKFGMWTTSEVYEGISTELYKDSKSDINFVINDWHNIYLFITNLVVHPQHWTAKMASPHIHYNNRKVGTN